VTPVAPPPLDMAPPPPAEPPDEDLSVLDTLDQAQVPPEVVDDEMPAISEESVDSALMDSIAQSVASEGLGNEEEVPTTQSELPEAVAAADQANQAKVAAEQQNEGAANSSKPRAGVDLAEIDRYLEGLGKL